VAKDRQIQNLRSKIELQQNLVQQVRALETGLKTLRSKQDAENQQNKQLRDKVRMQRQLLALKEAEIYEAKSKLTMKEEALSIVTEASRITQLGVDQFITKVKQMQDTMQNHLEELHFMEAVNTPNANQLAQRLIEQNKQLAIHLKQADKEARLLLGTMASSTAESKAARNVTKGKRAKKEPEDGWDESNPRSFTGAAKRPRNSAETVTAMNSIRR
jgi:hypothetical protein